MLSVGLDWAPSAKHHRPRDQSMIHSLRCMNMTPNWRVAWQPTSDGELLLSRLGARPVGRARAAAGKAANDRAHGLGYSRGAKRMDSRLRTAAARAGLEGWWQYYH